MLRQCLSCFYHKQKNECKICHSDLGFVIVKSVWNVIRSKLFLISRYSVKTFCDWSMDEKSKLCCCNNWQSLCFVWALSCILTSHTLNYVYTARLSLITINSNRLCSHTSNTKRANLSWCSSLNAFIQHVCLPRPVPWFIIYVRIRKHLVFSSAACMLG